MANVWIDSEILEAIGDALRYQHETNNKFYPREMASTIESSEGVGTLDDYFGHEIYESTTYKNDMNKSGGMQQLIKKFPKITIPNNQTSLAYAFHTFKGKVSPIISDNQVTNFNNMFYNCNNLKKVLPFDTSSGTNFGSMFYGCKNLTNIPCFNTSNGTDFRYMLWNCQSLTFIPKFDTSNGTNFNSMFGNCKNITSIPLLDTSNGIDFSYMFANCENLISIPLLNTSKGTDFKQMFINCSKITIFPQIDTNKGTNFDAMFMSVSNEETFIPLLDFSSATNVSNIFYQAGISNLGGFLNLGKAYLITQSANYSYYTFNLSELQILTHDSLINVINNLYDIATKGCNVQKLTLGSTNMSKLTVEEIAIATSKGWTVS